MLLISGNLDTAIMSCLQEFDGTQFFMTMRRVTFPHAKLDSRGFTLSDNRLANQVHGQFPTASGFTARLQPP